MIFDYYVVKTKSIDVDFKYVYDYIVEKIQENISVYEVYLEFIDNVEYYIQDIYNSDFLEEDNEYCIERIISQFEQYLEKTYGENWDEV